MPNKVKTKYVSLYTMHVPVLILAAAVVGVGVLAAVSSSKPKDITVLGSKNQNVKGSKKTVTIKEAKTPKGQEHRQVLTNVVTTLDEVADTEETAGNTQTSEDVADLADSTEENASDTVETVDELESESPFKKFVLGPDYKNLGQLRSSLAHTENAIRKLDKAVSTVTPETTTSIEASRTALDLEKTKIYNLVSQYEGQFSLLGWVSRLLTGYTPIEPEPTATPTSTPTPAATATPVTTATPTPTP